MALLSTNRIAWTYTDESGVVTRVSALKAHTDQAKQGGGDGSAVVNARPPGTKMRRVTCRTATGLSRVFPLYATGAPLATAGETINANVGSDSQVFISKGNPLPETHVIHNVTSQST